MTFLINVAKLSILDVCGGPGYTSGNSATWIKCKKKKLQNAKSAKEEECKTKTLQWVKVQHEIEQYIKKSATWKNILPLWNKEKVHKN